MGAIPLLSTPASGFCRRSQSRHWGVFTICLLSPDAAATWYLPPDCLSTQSQFCTTSAYIDRYGLHVQGRYWKDSRCPSKALALPCGNAPVLQSNAILLLSLFTDFLSALPNAENIIDQYNCKLPHIRSIQVWLASWRRNIRPCRPDTARKACSSIPDLLHVGRGIRASDDRASIDISTHRWVHVMKCKTGRFYLLPTSWLPRVMNICELLSRVVQWI